MCEYAEQDGPLATRCHIPLAVSGAMRTTDRDGYAHIMRRVDGKPVRKAMHRWRYEREVGPIPEGMALDHLCRNRACCNPAHLEPVTAAENVRRSGAAKLSAQDVATIRTLVAGGMSQSAVARKYGVHQSHISRVVRGHFWAEGACPAWEQVKRRKCHL